MLQLGPVRILHFFDIWCTDSVCIRLCGCSYFSYPDTRIFLNYYTIIKKNAKLRRNVNVNVYWDFDCVHRVGMIEVKDPMANEKVKEWVMPESSCSCIPWRSAIDSQKLGELLQSSFGEAYYRNSLVVCRAIFVRNLWWNEWVCIPATMTKSRPVISTLWVSDIQWKSCQLSCIVGTGLCTREEGWDQFLDILSDLHCHL